MIIDLTGNKYFFLISLTKAARLSETVAYMTKCFAVLHLPLHTISKFGKFEFTFLPFRLWSKRAKILLKMTFVKA